MFSKLSLETLARAALFQDAPVYVQFYITARCNLTCQQCNIIYSNADVRECTLDEIERIADNLAKLKVAIVLLTGGEPFVRKDLSEIVRAFESRGVHVRMQTNGLATEEDIVKVVEAGGRDISVSLDSLKPLSQDKINGDFPNSWHRALQSMAHFTKYLPRESSFASLGCVLQRENLEDVESVIWFGTEIDWYTSLVPVHVTNRLHPMSFRTFDQTLQFRPEDYARVDEVIERIREMRTQGFLLYDSDPYLDDVKRFAKGDGTNWRSKNHGVCDSPNLYFAILPNGHFAPCCDHRMSSQVATFAKDFPRIYKTRRFRSEVFEITGKCSGCMYGSYPEMTISMRFLAAKIERMRLFLASPRAKKWPVSYEKMLEIAERIRSEQSCCL